MAKPTNVISHWHHLIENFQASTQEFYTGFERAVLARGVPEARGKRVLHKEGNVASAGREYVRFQRGKYAFDICAAPFGNGFFISWWFTEPALKFGFLYFVAIFVAVVIATNIAYATGAAIGLALSGVGLAFVFGTGSAFIGMPVLLWLIGNGFRQRILVGESTLLAIPIIGRIYEWVFAPETFYSVDTGLMFQDAVHNAVIEVMDCMTTSKGVRSLTEGERKPILKRFAASV